MKFLIIGLILLIFSNAFSLEWKIQNKIINLEKITTPPIYISKDCNKCDAIKAFESSKNLKINSKDLEGGKILGAVNCLKLEGTSVTGEYHKRRLNFCLFKDGSVIQSSNLEN